MRKSTSRRETRSTRNGVTRRDFLNGVAIGAGGLMLPACGSGPDSSASVTTQTSASLSAPDAGVHYPPTLTGMRGSHDGSYEVAHALAWDGEKPDQYETLDEDYDLVVVGGGMSGLAAAWFYRDKLGPEARILILDNHDDFGGHAKRNEFHHQGRMVLSLGGAQNLENPGSYSESSTALLNGLGIDQAALDAIAAATPDDFALSANPDAANGIVLPGPNGHVVQGGNWFKVMLGFDGYADTLRGLPLPKKEQDKLIAFLGGDRDYLDELSLGEKYDYAQTVSYNQFLTERVGLAEDTLTLFDNLLLIYRGLSGWNMSVLEAVGSGAPGLRAMGWLGNLAQTLAMRFSDSLMEVRMFPDGNASIARLLVQQLIPNVAPAMKGVEDVAVARFNYAALDAEEQTIRLRLNSTVVGVRETDDEQVWVDYVQKGKPVRVSAKSCILACYNGLIPHLCPEMPDAQKEALKYGVKTPFVYANVLLDNGRAFHKLGATMFQCPGDPFQFVSAAPTMSVGGYQPPRNADDPMAIFMMSFPVQAPQKGVKARDLFRYARHLIYSTSFDVYEKQVREQLQAILGPQGFDHAVDIRAITVNRISHGYAYHYLALEDPEWPDGQAPHEIGRAQFGRISIANSDSEARAYMDSAWDAAFRAVEEQTV
ncbi:NAD(P)-binding protein [Pseudohalioglobus sediminis]|jgi:spermidine dehydrogenase|uniref:NAD(P)-binding protein n=1 Tax=Pseudohalioglobus sediminis TaxID=2606449 RepID=A0A5B0WZY8_9GAMM|nr:FAD/NAD(P)-binding protein [Pseudohalioglobus sediminis]KAA1192654.1 NAD(P)-binding protein [Pseudohalioglobus sediminis]